MNALVSTHSHPSSASPKNPVVRSENDPDKNPHLRLWRGLKPVVTEASCLNTDCRVTTALIKSVDCAPRHDTHLDGEKWSEVVSTAVRGDGWALDTAEQQLARSIDAIKTARRAIYGQFRGEEKVKTEDALTRHLAEAQRLLATFKEIDCAPQIPRQPYLIRQKCLSGLLLQIGTLLDLITPLRRQFNAEEFTDGLLAQLIEQEAVLFRLRSKISKWRDNPSQRLGAKLEVCLEQTIVISDAVCSLRDAAQAECKRQGMVFYNRLGAEQ